MSLSQESSQDVAAALAQVGLVPRGRVPWNLRRRPRSTVCAGCRGPRDRGLTQAYCRKCHAEHARATRPKHSELDPEAKRRANCRRYTNMLVARGKLDKLPCACGAIDVTAVHRDYDDPYNVTWRCKACRTATRIATAA